MKSLLLDIFGVSTIKKLPKEYGWGAIIFSLIIIWPTVGFLPSMPQPILYAAMAGVGIWSLSNATCYSTPLLCLLLYIPVEILISGAPSFFSPWMRFILFTFMLMSVSSLFGSERLYDFRNNVLHLIIIWCVILGTGSFIARFLGINYMKSFWGTNLTTFGHFGGLTSHSMLLGPISGISTIYLIHKFIITQHKLLLILAVMSIGSVMFSASRAALLATVAALLVLFYLLNRFSKRIIRYILMFAIVGAVSFPYWSNVLMQGFVAKNGGSTTELSTSSRDSKWENRINEFESDPIFGIGFSTVDLNNYYDYSPDGGIETGSSWLSVLSMTGIIGAALILWIMIKSLSPVFRNPSPEDALICAIVTLFIVSMMAEGYIFAGGNFLCIIFWLALGCACDYNKISSYENSSNSTQHL